MPWVVFHWRLHRPRRGGFTASHLSSAQHSKTQYQATVKLPGSFRLAAGSRHLRRHYNFAESPTETALGSLRLSCGSDFTRRGISLP